MNHKKGFTLIELLVVVGIIGMLAAIVLAALGPARAKSRDSNRISTVRQLKYALELYYDKFGQYPTCLKPGGSCTTTLQGSGFIGAISNDPLSGLSYTYAATGAGANCSGYHIGTSLEEKTNKIMLTGADASPNTVCTGSAVDFSGLSYAAGGQLCNAVVGIPQPTGAATGETCYDLTN